MRRQRRLHLPARTQVPGRRPSHCRHP